MRPFWTPARMEYASVCYNLRTEKEGIYVKKLEYETNNWYTSDIPLQSFTSTLRESLTSLFEEFFAIDKIFILAGGLGTRLSFYEVLWLSWYFLIS